ncbi:hypothetical protein Calkro_0685 [Caldicellulosiruptor kronotskyensis 2002]|uniref:Uncharacterized protein n=1 Tax=Caldicellulosiruptor kronotskyensis (strain DSM 18902 / VKM B-2412 / 2002) TaxID=632348 RepID=E4SEU1_CALK2|nr:hypothetical protein [Caldicellulosiruptor kronotskyensis]ADQ45578.1 hypothetical protein Calkro_0685 [Caldicellulosiruptor kronotskyensis 2002]
MSLCIRKFSEDPEIEALRRLFAEVLILTKEDIQSPVPRGCYDGRNEPWRVKMEALNFIKSEYCQLICDFLGIDYERYKKVVLKKFRPALCKGEKKNAERKTDAHTLFH